MARILQARIRSPGSFYKIFSPGHLPNPGIEPRSSTLQTDSLPAEPPQKRFVWESPWKFCSLGVNPLSESTPNPVSLGKVVLSVLSSQPASEWGWLSVLIYWTFWLSYPSDISHLAKTVQPFSALRGFVFWQMDRQGLKVAWQHLRSYCVLAST